MTHSAPEEKKNHEWLSTGEVANLTGHSDESIRNWIKFLPSVYVRRTPGRHYRLRRETVDFILGYKDKRG